MGLRKRKLKVAIISILAFGTTLGITFGYAFADRDVATLLDEWFSKKVMIAQSKIDSAIQSEKEIQMARVDDAIKKVMDEADRKLEEYTAAEIEARTSAIREHADYLISNLHISIENDKAQISSKLDLIMGSVLGAMDQLSDSYVPPAPVFERKEPVLPQKDTEPVEKDQTPKPDQPDKDETPGLPKSEELEADEDLIDDTEQDPLASIENPDDADEEELAKKPNMKDEEEPQDSIGEADEAIVNPEVTDDLDIQGDELDVEIQDPVQPLNPLEEVVEEDIVEQPVSEVVTEHSESVEGNPIQP